MDGRGLTECRSAADAGWQSSDTALPIGQVFWQLCWLNFAINNIALFLLLRNGENHRLMKPLHPQVESSYII